MIFHWWRVHLEIIRACESPLKIRAIAPAKIAKSVKSVYNATCCRQSYFAMLTVRSTEAKDRLEELFRAAERGQTVAITKLGKVIVHMVPVPEVADSASYQQGVERFLRQRSNWKPCSVTVEDILSARNEGRRS